MPDVPEIPGAIHAGGLWCHEVLEHLDAYGAGALPDDVRAAADAHLRACDRCERFGGVYAGLVASLRRQLGAAPPLDDDRARRVEARLQAMLDGG